MFLTSTQNIRHQGERCQFCQWLSAGLPAPGPSDPNMGAWLHPTLCPQAGNGSPERWCCHSSQQILDLLTDAWQETKVCLQAIYKVSVGRTGSKSELGHSGERAAAAAALY